MIEDKIKDSLVRYLNNSASASDLDFLNDWVKDETNYSLFKEYIKTHFTIIIGMNNPDPSEIRKRLLEEIRKDKKVFRKTRFTEILKYAAIAILLVSMGYFFNKENLNPSAEQIVVIKDNQITLELDTGETISVVEDGTSEILDSEGNKVGLQNGNRIIYGNSSAEQLKYNTLKIPYGKRFDIVLSDGTKVYLNAGSSLKYPVQFLKGKERKVFLEGEAFFEVAHDKENSFAVNAQELNVEVYGTKFNLSNYPEEENTEVVLTEGSVGLSYERQGVQNKEKIYLEPGFKGAFDRTEKTISTKKVNTSLYTSWIDGNLVFRKATFEHIVRRLERQYNVVIIINNDELAIETFNATIETDRETIEEVFDYFAKVYDIEYEFINNKILIN